MNFDLKAPSRGTRLGRRGAARDRHDRAAARLHLGRATVRLGIARDHRPPRRPSDQRDRARRADPSRGGPDRAAHLLRRPVVALSSIALFLVTATMFSITAFVPLFLETTTGATRPKRGWC
jgi:hypothetical protein